MYYRLAKWLYPKHPRLVRERKLRMLCFTIFLIVTACLFVGSMLLLLYHLAKR